MIHIDLFATLDLVGQAPGAPDEDPDGFAFGGWQAPLFDDTVGEHVSSRMQGMDALCWVARPRPPVTCGVRTAAPDNSAAAKAARGLGRCGRSHVHPGAGSTRELPQDGGGHKTMPWVSVPSPFQSPVIGSSAPLPLP